MKSNPFIKSDLFILILLAAIKLTLHLLTNNQYGFHRDELATLHDARNLSWGFIAYPPLTPFLASIELKFFGTSLVGFRFFSALAQSIVMVIAGLMAKELGGARKAQIFAAFGTGIGVFTLIQGALFQYVAFDFLWVVLLAYFTIRLLKSDDFALVAGDRHSHWLRHDDALHDGCTCYWFGSRGLVLTNTETSQIAVAVGGCNNCHHYLLTQSPLANPAQLHLARISKIHP